MPRDLTNLSISEFLPADYLAPWGTKLTPSDFRYFTTEPTLPRKFDPDAKLIGYWEATARDAAGSEVTYTIGLPLRSKTGNTAVWVNGVETKPGSAVTMGHRLMPISDAYDWVLRQDAQQQLNEAQPEWGGHSLEAMMRRAEYGITAYDQVERNVADFVNIKEIQAWLDKQLAGTAVKAEAFRLLPFLKQDLNSAATKPPNAVQMLTRHWHPELDHCQLHGEVSADGTETKVSKYGVNSLLDASEFYGQSVKSYPITPEINFHYDGATLERYTAKDVVTLAALNNKKNRLFGRRQKKNPVMGLVWAADDDGAEVGAWWGIAIRSLDLALTFPVRGTNLTVSTDDDGAAVTITAESTQRRARLNHLTDKFERDWGKWLDPSATLTAKEVHDGIKKAEAAVAHPANGLALTKELLDEWLAYNAATVPTEDRARLFSIGPKGYMLFAGDSVLFIFCARWPEGNYMVDEDKQIWRQPLDQGLPELSMDDIWNLAENKVIPSKYLAERGYRKLTPALIPTWRWEEKWIRWINQLPGEFSPLKFVFMHHIANKRSKMDRLTKDWYRMPTSILDSTELTETINM